MRRREFVAGLAGATAWPLVAGAQQPARMRRVGVLLGSTADPDSDAQARIGTFLQALEQLGWTEVATCRSTSDEVRPIWSALANTPRNWSGLRPMSSSLLVGVTISQSLLAHADEVIE
jgi:hypothetical protein